MQPTPSYLVRSTLAESRARWRRHRPLGVVLIALYGFACAILLGYGLWQGWQFNQFHPDFGQERLLSHADDILIVMPITIVIHVLLSIGLLMCRQTARLGRIALSAANLAVFHQYQSFFFQEVPLQIDLAGQTIKAILLVDIVIFCYLAFLPEVSHSFQGRN